MDKKMAIYPRVSSDEQRENMSIETQEQFLSDYCRLYGHSLIYPIDENNPYRDNGVSGTVPFHERLGGSRLLKDIEEGLIGTVLVYKLDRVGRSLINVLDAHDRIERAGASLKSATEPLDTSNPSGRLIFHMLASFAEYERENLRERTLGGMKRFYKSGKYNGRIPYGYDLKDGLLTIEEGEAKVVRELMLNLANGSTIRNEARRLNAMGIPSPGYRYSGNRRKHGESWTVATISKMVSRSTYAGSHVVKSGNEELVRECPAIVDESLWKRAVSQVKKNKKNPIHTKGRNYLLSGLMRCAVCGTPYRGNGDGKGYFRYTCGDSVGNSLTPKFPKKHAPNLPAREVESYVWSKIRGFVLNPGSVIEKLNEQKDETEVGGLEERKQHLAKRLQEKSAEKDRYVKLYAKGSLSEGEADEYIRTVIVETDHLRMLQAAVESDIAESRMEEKQNERTINWLSKLSGKLEEVEADTQEAFATRRFLTELLLDSVSVSREETDDGSLGSPVLNMTWNFNLPEEDSDGKQEDSSANTFVYAPSRGKDEEEDQQRSQN